MCAAFFPRGLRLEWRDVAFRRQRRHRQTNMIVYIVTWGISLCVCVCVCVGSFRFSSECRFPQDLRRSSDRSGLGLIFRVVIFEWMELVENLKKDM